MSKVLPQNHLSNLSLTLTDERFGLVGHSNSNGLQLKNAGLNLNKVAFLPVLNGGDLAQTVNDYTKSLLKELNSADYSLALAGMGSDGHIFGIKPESPAVNSAKLVEGYKWDDYTRITPTFKLLERLDEIVIYAEGKEKSQQLDNLDKELPLTKYPVHFLKTHSKVKIFNDHRGE